MNKKQDKTLREKGFIPLEEYMQDNLLQFEKRKGNFNLRSMEKLLETIRFYDEASQRFHSPGGDGFYIIQRCLQKYLDYKFMQQNNHFRFTDGEYEGAETGDDEYEYIRVQGKPDREISGSKADIYYLLYQADQTSCASRRCEQYTRSNRLHLTAVLIRLIERTVESMETDSSNRMQTYGKFLRTVYMNEDYREKEVAELMEILGVSKKQYYRTRNEAIGFLSESLFGILAGENGMAELYTDKDSIIIPTAEE